jgi:hypothetical protein
MHRHVLIAAAAALPLFLAAPADAQTRGGGSWCAGQTIGADSWTEDCSYRSLAACRRQVIAGNKGVCSPNAYGYARKKQRAYRRY